MIAKKGTGQDSVGRHAPGAKQQWKTLAAPGAGAPVPPIPSTEETHLTDELLAHKAALEIRNGQLEETRRRLEKERKKFTHLFDAAPVGYLVLSKQGDVMDVNLTFSLMMGTSQSHMVGNAFSSFVAEDQRGAWEHFLNKLFHAVTRESCETILYALDGRSIDVMIDGIMNNSGHACLIAVTDVSALKRAVEERYVMAKLDSFGEMASGIAHDFNNLLSVILMNLDLSRMLIPPGADLQHLMDEAGKALQQATTLTNRLLSLSDVGAPARKPVKLGDFLQHSVELALAGSTVTAEFDIAEDLWTSRIDPRQFERVIRNLVINAREAMPDGGTIKVAAKNEVVVSHGPTTLPDGNYVRISITDHGVGIPKEERTRIFDPYFSTKRRGGKKGLGLGLSTCHTIMKNHGGAIFVESDVGIGTSMHLLFPVIRPGGAAEIAIEPEAAIRLGRILVMDDEAGVRKSVGQVLQVFGHDVTVATEGGEAVKLYREAIEAKKPYDVVLLDLTVKDGQGGRETMQALREMNPEAKGVVMSGFTQDPVIMNFEDYGFCDYLIKPFGQDQLRAVLARLLQEKPVEETEEVSRESEYDSLVIVRPLRNERGLCVDAEIEFANETWRRDFGFIDRDPAGLKIKEGLPSHADRIHFIFQVADTGKPFRYVKSMPGDETRWFDYQLVPYGEKVILSSREITREYRLEYAMRESEERFRAALEFSPDATALFKPVYDHAGRFTDLEIIYANRAPLAQWFNGMDIDRVRGKSLFALKPELRDMYFDIFKNVAETGREFRDTLRVAGTAEPVWLDTRAAMYVGGIVYTSRDVTQSKLTEKALKESLDHLKEAQRAAQLGSWIADPAGYTFEWSEQLYRMFGLDPATTPEATSELFWNKIIHPDDRRIVEDAFAGAVGHGEAYTVEFRSMFPAGVTKWLEMRGAAILVPGETAQRMQGTIQDITARKLAQIELVDANERLIRAQEAGDVALWDVDNITSNYYWSPRLYTMFGIDPTVKPPSFETWMEILHPDDRDNAYLITQAAFAGTCEPVQEFRIIRPDGEVRWIANRGKVISDAAGKIVRLSGACIDITERKKFEEMQARQQLELDDVQRVGHVGSWRWDPDIDEVIWSDELFRIFGLEPGPSVRAPSFKEQVEKFFTPFAGKQLVEAVQQCRENGRPYELTVELVRPDGEHRFCVARGAIKRGEHRLHGTLTDVTDLHQAEIRLSQAERHETIGRLAGGVAHDFNNQLQIILGLTELILARLPSSDLNHDHLLDIQKAGEHAADLTRQLLAFSRRQLIRPVKMDINEQLAEMLRMVQRLLGEGIKLIWEPADPIDAVMMDTAQLKQVMINLCINARDAMNGRGTIRITTANVALDTTFCSTRPNIKPGPYVLLTVSDTGCGMEKEVLDHIFEPFFTTKAFGDGSGLGLATVEGAIQQNHGMIEVDSTPGAGTTFRIYFPSYIPAGSRRKSGATDASANASMKGHGETIIIIDDERQVLEVGRRLLRTLGYQVLEVKNAADVLSLVRTYQGTIDLLITDVIMPDMNGPELAAQVAAIRPEIKCLFMSGYTSDQISQSGALTTDKVVMEKPFSRATLSQYVRKTLDQTITTNRSPSSMTGDNAPGSSAPPQID